MGRLYVSVFLCLKVITLEGWVEIMYYVMDAHSFYNFIYFILLIIVSSCCLRLSLCSAVISHSEDLML